MNLEETKRAMEETAQALEEAAARHADKDKVKTALINAIAVLSVELGNLHDNYRK